MAAAAADMVDNNMGSPSITATRSPQYHFGESVKKAASVPWSQVAAQVELQPVVAAPPAEAAAVASSSVDDSGANGGTSKKASWSRPSGGIVAEAAVPVIEVDYWPSLSAATVGKSSRKSSSESVKSLVDGLSPMSQGLGNAFASPASHPSSERQLNSHVDDHPNVNSPMSTRQRSMKRNNGNPPSNGDAPQTPGPRNPAVDSQSSNSSLRDDSQRSGSASENHGGNEHQQPHRNSFRNRGGAYQRRDGSHSQNYGNRRDHDRGNQEWNSHHGGFNHNREARMQQQRGYPRNGVFHPPPPLIRPASGPFIPPTQPQNFGRPPYAGMQHPQPMYYLPIQHPMDFVSPMQPHMVYIPQPDPTLPTRIMNQVNYYFSNDNLVKDTYLRRNMDDEGWVPVALIAGFKKMSQLTGNLQLILDVIRTSSFVEVQGDKLRRRNDWNKWIMPPAIRFPVALGAQYSSDSVAASVQTVSLGEGPGNSDAGNAEADAPADSSTGSGS